MRVDDHHAGTLAALRLQPAGVPHRAPDRPEARRGPDGGPAARGRHPGLDEPGRLESHADLGFDHAFVGVRSIGEARDAFLADRQIDAMVADEVILRALLRGSGAPAGTELLDVRLGGENYGFMMRHEDAAFVRAVDDALADVFASEEYTRLVERWFVDELPGLGFGLGMDPADEAFVPRTRKTGKHPAETGETLAMGTGGFDEHH